MKLQDITYLEVTQENTYNKSSPKYIVFDNNSDLSIEQTANVTENPIDASLGASMQENRIIDMISVGISGSFSERNKERNLPVSNRSMMFSKEGRNRLETIVDWFEKALDNKLLFTVCKKGVLYKNQLLNSIKWSFDESVSKIDISLSFIEVEMAERAELEGSVTIIAPLRNSSGSITNNKAFSIYTLD